MTGNSDPGRDAIKVLKTEADYETALAAIEVLMDKDPAPGTPEADRLELLTLLAEDYEDRQGRASLPDPIEAIRFRMEQQGLRQADLVPYIGSRSKVSELLSRKRPLTLSMIRALHKGLGIPANVLLQGRGELEVDLFDADIDWQRFPIAEMVSRGWLREPLAVAKERSEEVLKEFFRTAGGFPAGAVLYRRTNHVRSARTIDPYALAVWTARVAAQGLAQTPSVPYERGVVDRELMTEVARLSWADQGPLLAIEFLFNHGIVVVIEPHLRRTHLDAAAFLLDIGRPVIALTLRHDRLDNFWFCLMHELAHISLHLNVPKKDNPMRFFDDLDTQAKDDPLEADADHAAGEALIPEDEWRKSPASRLRTPEAVEHLARKLRIHPAIVAGRIRYQYRSFRVLSGLVGQGQVRSLFPDIKWPRGT
ncbi:MAG: ImmA/IrrE family metallo-endopeptidase [Gemmatimonadota bacterium]